MPSRVDRTSGDAPSTDGPVPDKAVRRLSWATLLFTVAVILGGMVVRATGSGAGCGDTYPRCDGHIIPIFDNPSTAIEFTHRMMTAALGLAFVALVVVVARRYGMRSRVGRPLAWSIGFFLGEVAIGALLVVFGWVEDDASIGRLIAVSVHLVNTFLLLGALTVTVHVASGGRSVRLDRRGGPDGRVLAGVGVLLVVGASGAINALADTLFPAGDVAAATIEAYGSAGQFLIDARTLHPLIAVAGGVTLFFLARSPQLALGPRERRLAITVQAIIGLQMLVGVVNIAMLTPLETQIVHLLVADILWIVWVFLAAAVLSRADDPATVPVGEAA